MNTPMLKNVRRRLDGIKICATDSSELTRTVADANARAVDLAQHRLEKYFPRGAVSQLKGHFAKASFLEAEQGSSDALRWPVDRLLRHLCTRVQSVALGKKGEGLQIGLNSASTPDALDIGDPIEPHSDLYALEPRILKAAAEANASVEIRLFERQLPEWAAIADDFIAVSGADIFMKLFIAGGDASVNGWHRDNSDVFATVLDGRKRFQVGATAHGEGAACDVDTVLAPGDVVLIPRSRLHNVTPVHGVSALLSIGLMRRGDWSYLGQAPTHLGLTDVRSAQLYRFALHSHSPMGLSVPNTCRTWRSKVPGGIGIVSESGDRATFVAGGQLWEAELNVVKALALIHGTSQTTSGELARDIGQSEAWCIDIGAQFIDFGLVQPA